VGKINDDQVADFAERRQLNDEDARRLLRPNLLD
jgi:5-methyltetrahydrofolate--homocysteine methyltransferase